MKLVKLPYLVQRHILKQMTYAELFFLSFTSKKMTTLISNIGWGEIKYIRYEASKDNCIEVSALFDEEDLVQIFRIFPKKSVNEKQVNELKFDITGVTCGVFQYNEMYNEPVRPVPFLHHLNGYIEAERNLNAASQITIWPHLAIFSNHLNEDPAVEAIHNRIDRLFGKNVKYELKIVSENEGNAFLPKHIKFNKMFLNSDGIDVNSLEEYFSSQPKHEHVQIDETRLIGRFNPNSKIFDADTLMIDSIGPPEVEPDFLNNFRGRRVLFWDVKSSDDMMIQFLKKWKFGESFHSLKTLRLNCWSRTFNPDRIKQESGIKELKPSGNFPVVDAYKLPDCINCPFIIKRIPHTISFYIVREDGIVAYVDIKGGRFVFEVQEFTETEMLEGYRESV